MKNISRKTTSQKELNLFKNYCNGLLVTGLLLLVTGAIFLPFGFMVLPKNEIDYELLWTGIILATIGMTTIVCGLSAALYGLNKLTEKEEQNEEI